MAIAARPTETARSPSGARARRLRLQISMRWWLALAFALVAALTAIAVGRIYLDRSEAALRARAKDIAVGRSVGAAAAIVRGTRSGTPLAPVVAAVAERRDIALFTFDGQGRATTPIRSNGVGLGGVPDGPAAIRAALGGDRFVSDQDGGRVTVVGLPLRAPAATAMVAYVPRVDAAGELSVVRDATIVATVASAGVGALAGLLIAALIAARLRRIGAAAADIADGRFEHPLHPGFPDELGALTLTIDRMRTRLRDSFNELESERRRLRRLLERLHEGVIAVDSSLRVVILNPKAASLLDAPGLTEGAELPDPWPDPSLRGLAHDLFAVDAEAVQYRAEPDLGRAYQIAGLPPRRAGESAVLVLTDLSEAERRELAQRDFVANAAHQLRTPLTTIIGAADVLQAGAKEDPELRDRFLAHIHREAGRLGRLTRALLVLVRAQSIDEAPRRTTVPVRAMLEEAAASARPHPGVDIEVSCPSCLSVTTDPDLIEQALGNLVANAASHTAAGRIRLSGRREDGDVILAVEDTGSGMSAGDRERVFDRFFRGRGSGADGFGLGLAIVRQSVEAVNGTVEIDSEPGSGTTARLVLPAGRGESETS